MEEEDKKTVVTAKVQYEAPFLSALDNGIPVEVKTKDEDLVKDAARFDGKKLDKSNFERETNQREIYFTFPDWARASEFRDIVKTRPGMNVSLSKPGGDSKPGRWPLSGPRAAIGRGPSSTKTSTK